MMPAGTYYIGDLSLALLPEFDKKVSAVELKDKGVKVFMGSIFDVEGVRIYSVSTGMDGTYADDKGRIYDVEGARLCCVRLDDVIKWMKPWPRFVGHVHSFPDAFECSHEDQTVFHFGHVDIVQTTYEDDSDGDRPFMIEESEELDS